MIGGDDIARIIGILERSAVAQEKLIELATAEREINDNLLQAPLCPHCGRIDPSIRNEGGTGKMSEFVLIANCQNCGNTFLAESNGWTAYRSKDEYERRGNDIS